MAGHRDEYDLQRNFVDVAADIEAGVVDNGDDGNDAQVNLDNVV